MEIKEQRSPEFTTLIPVGDLDANSSIHLDERIQHMLDAGQVRIHIDGSRIAYISSAGLGVFVSHLEDIQSQGGKLILSGLKDSVKDVFVLLGLDQLLTIVETPELAAELMTNP